MSTGDTNFDEELRALMVAGHKIEAIKQYRAATGAGLAEAKDTVEACASHSLAPKRFDVAVDSEEITAYYEAFSRTEVEHCP